MGLYSKEYLCHNHMQGIKPSTLKLSETNPNVSGGPARQRDSISVMDMSGVNSVLWRREGIENEKKGIGQM